MKNRGYRVHTDTDAMLRQATAHLQKGQLKKAETLLKQILKMSPGHADANHLLGILVSQRGQHDLACRLIDGAIKTDPRQPAYYDNLGLILYREGRLDEALAACDRAIELAPESAMSYYNRGVVLMNLGRAEDALEAYRQVVRLNPQYAEAYINLGNVLKDLGRLEEALEAYERVIQLKPEHAEAHYNIGNVYKDQGKNDQALACFQKALSLKPDFIETIYNMGNVFKDQGRRDQALACYQSCLSHDPEFARAQWALAMAQIPILYRQDDNPSMCRSEFSRQLDELSSWFNADRAESGYQSVGSQQPFYLVYQEENNRDLLSRYGALCVRLMENWRNKQGFKSASNSASGIVKVGIVSAHIQDHSVWNALVKGWVQNLNRKHFEIHVFHTGTKQDEETAWARSQSTFFAEGVKGLHEWIRLILEKQPDVLIYPEIGMDQMTLKLACLRLAPAQVAAWGHPETTGLPTMDYYLSAEGFEPPDAMNNYTEKLVSLPRLGACYHPLPVVVAEPNFADLNIDLNYPILLCAGTPYKYAPQHDWVLVEIARKLGRCQLVFFTHRFHEVSELLYQRLESVFTRAGLDFNQYVVLIPWQERPVFYGLMRYADVLLDTIGFSGFNTAMQAMECGLPIVTLEGRFMRGRLASGVLRRMGLSELIVDGEEGYMALAVKLSKDAEYRRYIQERIEAGRHTLFDDVDTVRALAEFLTGAVNKV